jgi:hypothetical protein
MNPFPGNVRQVFLALSGCATQKPLGGNHMETTTMIQTDKSDVETVPAPKGRLWTGAVMTTLSALFLFRV